MFQPNQKWIEFYSQMFPGNQETFIDFGVPPVGWAYEDWWAELARTINFLRSRGWLLYPALFSPEAGVAPLYIVRLDRQDFKGPRPVDLAYLSQVVKQLLWEGQTTILKEKVLEIHILGN